jgi:hypothetical protein
MLQRGPHSRAHLREGAVDIDTGRTDTELLGFHDLILVVGQLVDHVLPRRLLVRT